MAIFDQEKLERRVALWHDLEGDEKRVQKMADAEGIHRRKMNEWIERAKREGFIGEFAGLVPEGHEVGADSSIFDKYGNRVRRTVHTRPARQEYTGEPGFAVKGRSTLLDSNGQIAAQWIKTKAEEVSQERTLEIVKEAFADYKPAMPSIQRPKAGLQDRLTVYPVLDWHLGMFAWGDETGGANWDLAIAKEKLLTTFAEVVDQAPASDHAVFMGLGDLLHADKDLNRTARSGNPLDVDTRYAKVLGTCCDLMAECAEMVASKHRKIEIAFKRGNHDDNSTAAILQAMRMFFRKYQAITIDENPNAFYWKEFGVNLLGGTHGDKQKLGDLPSVMANHQKEAWGRTSTRVFFTGHVHHEQVKEVGGVRVLSLRAPIPSDAYHASVGYHSGRSMYAFNFDADTGSKGSIEVEIK